jgi:hypothetical protein
MPIRLSPMIANSGVFPLAAVGTGHRAMSAAFWSDGHVVGMMKFAPFQRSASRGWRFGTRRIAEIVVGRLIASGRAKIEGERLITCHRPEGE